jgi:signal transduction histidine kinase
MGNMKLFTRYNRIILSVMIGLFLLSGIIYYFLLKFILIHELDEDLQEKKARIEQMISVNKQLPSTNIFDETVVSYAKVNSTQRHSSINSTEVFDDEDKHMVTYRQLVFTTRVGAEIFQVTIAEELEGTHTLLRLIIEISLGIVLFIIALFLVLNRFLLRKLWSPFYATIAALKDFKVSHSKVLALPETQVEEFSFLNQNLFQAIHEAQHEYGLLKEFTENASHEIQTPLAIIRSKLDLMVQQESLQEEQSEMLRQMYGAVKKLTRLNQSLLLLTKIENNQFPAVENIDLKEKVTDKLEQFQELWSNSDIKVDTDLSQCIVQANPELIDILLNNLFSNAIKHNMPGGKIELYLSDRKLVIKNSGQSKSLDKEKLFQRFYKAQSQAGSNGLGLSIIKEICTQSDIEIKYRHTGEEHVFTLYFINSSLKDQPLKFFFQ